MVCICGRDLGVCVCVAVVGVLVGLPLGIEVMNLRCFLVPDWGVGVGMFYPHLVGGLLLRFCFV